MVNSALEKAVNEQIKHELYSSYLYLHMSSFCTERNFPGFGRWLMMQSEEERSHAMKFYAFLHQHGNHVDLQAIEKPAGKYKSPKDVFENVLGHEQKVTALIRKLYELAIREKDYATQIFLQWFITEQVEEEANATEILQKFEMIEEQGPALVMLDRELGARSAS
ncbi:MAG TPA: ferritin [Bacteroidota bacterium]|nr:ferritin [Bacteroidota bacterium]